MNTTPVGMYPVCGQSPVEPGQFPQLRGVWDLIYNPARTELMLRADALGIPAFGGLPMLSAQAAAAVERFLGRKLPADAAERALRVLSAQTLNIALIGLPGCGKTTTGRALSLLTGRTCIDLDEEIVRAAGCTIPEYFARNGEDGFRALETRVLREFSQKSGQILATGGGVVTRPENLPLLRQNSRIVYLRRDTLHLPVDGRPVSQARGVAALARERTPLYEAWADTVIDAASPEDAAAKIKELFL